MLEGDLFWPCTKLGMRRTMFGHTMSLLTLLVVSTLVELSVNAPRTSSVSCKEDFSWLVTCPLMDGMKAMMLKPVL